MYKADFFLVNTIPVANHWNVMEYTNYSSGSYEDP